MSQSKISLKQLQDARPPVAPGAPIGLVPVVVTGTAPQKFEKIPGPFVSTGADDINVVRTSEFTVGGLQPVGGLPLVAGLPVLNGL